MSYNIFTERVEIFNGVNEQKQLAEMFSEKQEQLDAEWESYSITDIQNLLNITEDEAGKLLKSGIFKTYRVGNEYRASKKSYEDKKKVLNTMISYRDKKSMTASDVQRILGIGKTATYRLINQLQFKTYLVFGVMRVDVESFEEWYSGQFHYKKVNGERPGKKYGYTISPSTVAKVLGIPKSTAYDLMVKNKVDYILVGGNRRIKRKSFEKWLKSQNQFKLVKTIEEVEKYVD